MILWLSEGLCPYLPKQTSFKPLSLKHAQWGVLFRDSSGNYKDTVWLCCWWSNVGLWTLPYRCSVHTRDKVQNPGQASGQLALAYLSSLNPSPHLLFFLENTCQKQKQKELAIWGWGGHLFTKILLMGKMSLTLSAFTFSSAKWS